LMVWRLVYMVGAVVLVFVLHSRILYLDESTVWTEDNRLGCQSRTARKELEIAAKSYSKTQKSKGEASLHIALEFNGRDISKLRKNTKFNPNDKDGNSEASIDGENENCADKKKKKHSNEMQVIREKSNRSESDGDYMDIGITMSLSSLSEEATNGQTKYGMAMKNKNNEQDNVVTLYSDVQDESKLSCQVLLRRYYWHRLAGTCASWFFWDVAFYGNKLFQSVFIIAILGENATLSQISLAATANALVALMGYFAAANLVDNPVVGRVRLQQYGFVLTGLLFIFCGIKNRDDSSTTALLVPLYFASSFFGQCGPNTTTFLVPAGEYPLFPSSILTPPRNISHRASNHLPRNIGRFRKAGSAPGSHVLLDNDGPRERELDVFPIGDLIVLGSHRNRDLGAGFERNGSFRAGSTVAVDTRWKGKGLLRGGGRRTIFELLGAKLESVLILVMTI